MVDSPADPLEESWHDVMRGAARPRLSISARELSAVTAAAILAFESLDGQGREAALRVARSKEFDIAELGSRLWRGEATE